jgi:16S rRNA (guanine(527)-N(7))-methyltransferase RsmG
VTKGSATASLKELLLHAGIALESNAGRRLSSFLTLLKKWNARINLTASTEWEAIGPLFEEAVWAAQYYPQGAVNHLDIGSGAGFPALPLRILIPRIHLDMVESRSKRCVFLESAVHDLGLENVRIINSRLAAFLQATEGSWDCVSWKAVKLSSGDICVLAARATLGTRFWMFHGAAPAVGDPLILEKELQLEQREACPVKRGWWLSVYRKRCFT